MDVHEFEVKVKLYLMDEKKKEAKNQKEAAVEEEIIVGKKKLKSLEDSTGRYLMKADRMLAETLRKQDWKMLAGAEALRKQNVLGTDYIVK